MGRKLQPNCWESKIRGLTFKCFYTRFYEIRIILGCFYITYNIKTHPKKAYWKKLYSWKFYGKVYFGCRSSTSCCWRHVWRQTRHKMLKIKSQNRVNKVFGVSFDIKSDHETLKNNSFIKSCIETFLSFPNAYLLHKESTVWVRLETGHLICIVTGFHRGFNYFNLMLPNNMISGLNSFA